MPVRFTSLSLFSRCKPCLTMKSSAQMYTSMHEDIVWYSTRSFSGAGHHTEPRKHAVGGPRVRSSSFFSSGLLAPAPPAAQLSPSYSPITPRAAAATLPQDDVTPTAPTRPHEKVSGKSQILPSISIPSEDAPSPQAFIPCRRHIPAHRHEDVCTHSRRDRVHSAQPTGPLRERRERHLHRVHQLLHPH